MKSLVIAFTLLATVLTTSGFAADPKVSPFVLRSFSKTFTTATGVDWSLSNNMYKAQFTLNSQIITVFYEADGTLVAITRNITSNQLPVTLQVELKKDYPHFWISELFELSDENGTDYYGTRESADEKVILKSISNNSWSKYKKLGK
jgi:hypothetical protein